MPYAIEAKGSEWCVKNSDTGEELKCYPKKSAALKYLGALEANVEEANKSTDDINASRDVMNATMAYNMSMLNLDNGDFNRLPNNIRFELIAYSKAGRVLNAANTERLTNALAQIQSSQAIVVEVLGSAGIELPDGDTEPADDNVPDEAAPEEEKSMKFTQEETAYTILSPEIGKACANCRWFNFYEDWSGGSCQIVEGWPDPIVLTGLSNKWELREPYKPMPMEVVIVGDEKERKAQAELATTYEKPSVLAKVWDTIRRNLKRDEEYQPFQIVKVGERVLWIADYSNNFEDLDEEILSAKGHENFIWRLDHRLVPMPELWAAHIKGTRHGQAEKVVQIGNFITAVGTFDDTDEADDWQKFYAKHRVELSHGFIPNLKEFRDKVFNDFNTFEISTLPPGAAANPYTQFEEVIVMAVTEATKQYLEKALGTDKAAAKIAQMETLSEATKALGAKYKDFAKAPAAGDTSPEDITQDVQKSYAELLGELVDAQGELITFQTGIMDKALEQDKAIAEVSKGLAAIEKLETAIADINKKLGEPPRRATEANSTVLSKEQVEQIKAGQDTEEYDDFIPGAKIKKGVMK